MEQLHRCAERDIGFFDAAFENGLVCPSKDIEAIPEFRQKRRKERQQSLNCEFFAHGDERRALVGREIGNEFIDIIFAGAEGIRRQIGEFDAAGALVVQRASAAPGKA